MKTTRKKLVKWTAVLLSTYVIIGVTLYFIQEDIIFHPTQLSPDYHYQFSVPFKEEEITYSKTEKISLVKFYPTDSTRKGIVIYFHGNKDNVNHYARFANNFTKHGFEVWIEDYPEFGKSTGERSEKILYEQAEKIYLLATEQYHSNNVIIYGRSFGTGIAAYLASIKACKQVILETPYYSLPDIYNTYLPIYPIQKMCKYQLPTYQYMKSINAPVLIFQGKKDWVVPYSSALKLKPLLKPGDEFVEIDNKGHHNLPDFPAYHQKLDTVLNKL